MGRHSEHGQHGPDDPIYTQSFKVSSPPVVRQRPPEPEPEQGDLFEEDDDG